ncbi:hypothetical protein Sp245p_28820 (plasmid) [Azospirillum baldaniorum]|uniref:Uncharacterized protein n=1 Tax=Azospirillum baldaniorum TaxID=1064539 RepID=A0A9P1JY24_9PROT|nr:hypothetical protein [Azospirillum baldaniorum]AWJ93826.1 hypothetical protein Sp245p_28820 [Azospirillum baldaniorum]TWA81648.1 hypothetical protein FBZ85_10222 [Azospirillum brasilense]CCD01982.1 protein of unknown function [Azospirillum baldaniorum]
MDENDADSLRPHPRFSQGRHGFDPGPAPTRQRGEAEAAFQARLSAWAEAVRDHNERAMNQGFRRRVYGTDDPRGTAMKERALAALWKGAE